VVFLFFQRPHQVARILGVLEKVCPTEKPAAASTKPSALSLIPSSSTSLSHSPKPKCTPSLPPPALPFPRHSSDVAQAPPSDAWLQVFTLGGFPYFPAYDFPPFWFYLSTYRILCAQGSPAFAQSSPLHKKAIDLNRILICETNNVFLRHEGQAKLRKGNEEHSLQADIERRPTGHWEANCIGGITEP